MKNLLTRIKNNRGFIEIEYLVAAGIGLVVIAGFATGIQQMSSMQRRNDIAQDSNFLIEDLTNTIKSGDYCSTKFAGMTIPPEGSAMGVSFSYPMMDQGVDVQLEVGAEPLPGVSIKELALLRVPMDGKAVASFTTKDGTFTQVPAVLRIQTEKLVNGVKTAMKPRDIPLTLSLDSGEKVKYCNKEGLAAQACFESGGTYNETPGPGETKCLPANHCDYGGTFSDDPTNGFDNPLLANQAGNRRTCPAGYTAERSGTVSSITAKAKYNGKINNHFYGITTCIRCGKVIKNQGAASGGAFDDTNSFGPIENSIANVPYYQSGMAGHITSTGQQVGAYQYPPPPPPTPTPPLPPPPPTPDPNATPPPACTGNTYAVATTTGYEPSSQNDCPGGTTVVYGQFYGDPMYYGYWEPGYCVCNNYVPPTPPPTPTPVTCTNAMAAYEAQVGHDGACSDYGDAPASADPISCGVYPANSGAAYANKIYVYDVCSSGGYLYGFDGAQPSYIPPDPCYYNGTYVCGYPYY